LVSFLVLPSDQEVLVVLEVPVDLAVLEVPLGAVGNNLLSLFQFSSKVPLLALSFEF
jgi:hypothetical protein